jgi:hypothetical protein
MQSNNSTFSINSKHFTTRIENDIVQLVKTLIVEHQITVDEAKAMARKLVQNKINQMLTDEENVGIKELSQLTNNFIKAGSSHSCYIYSKNVYELL